MKQFVKPWEPESFTVEICALILIYDSGTVFEGGVGVIL